MIADDIVVVMRFNGVTLYPILSYAFPGLFYLKVSKRTSCSVVVNSVLSGVVIFLTALFCTKGIYDLMKWIKNSISNGTRTRNLLGRNQTRYHCAMEMVRFSGPLYH